jgi:hypothetical protein
MSEIMFIQVTGKCEKFIGTVHGIVVETNKGPLGIQFYNAVNENVPTWQFDCIITICSEGTDDERNKIFHITDMGYKRKDILGRIFALLVPEVTEIYKITVTDRMKDKSINDTPKNKIDSMNTMIIAFDNFTANKVDMQKEIDDLKESKDIICREIELLQQRCKTNETCIKKFEAQLVQLKEILRWYSRFIVCTFFAVAMGVLGELIMPHINCYQL